MKHVASALAFAMIIGGGAPAFAGGISFDLPHITYPEPPAPDAAQGCASPATLSDTRCAPQGN